MEVEHMVTPSGSLPGCFLGIQDSTRQEHQDYTRQDYTHLVRSPAAWVLLLSLVLVSGLASRHSLGACLPMMAEDPVVFPLALLRQMEMLELLAALHLVTAVAHLEFLVTLSLGS
jgi:hypothetical protein